MKKFMHNTLSFVLTLTFVITTIFSTGAVPALAAATKGSCGTNATWSYDAGTTTLTISGKGATKNYGIVSTVPWESYKPNITNLVVEEGITEIGNYNFYNCTALVNVSLPSTLTILHGSGTMTASYGCFQNCTSLQSITLPKNLTTIENCAFKDCTALKSITFPDSVTTLSYACFSGCTALETVTYGAGLTKTGDYAFYDSGVKRIYWGDNINTVNAWSFFKCKMTSVEFPDSVTSVGTRAFADCTFLKTITVNNPNTTLTGDFCNGSEQEITVYGHKASTAETFASSNNYKFVSIDACEHLNQRTVVSVEPTCLEGGVSQKVCDDCGAVLSESSLDALGHNYETTDTVNNTEVDGHIYTTETCTRCKDTKDTITHQPLTDGDTDYVWIEGNYTYTNTATCTRAGYEKYTCTVEGCGKTETHLVSSGKHNVESYTVTKAATCTENGEQSGTCTVCNATVTQSIPATGHLYDDTDILETVDNTAEDGHIHIVYICRNCKEQVVKTTHVNWVEGNYTATVISEAHCVINGLERDVCKICGETRTVTIPANGQHEWYVTSQTEPTCTAAGKIYYACKNCTMTKSENIDALGHDYVIVEGKGKAPTCLESGYDYYQCSRCTASKQSTLSALGHTVDESNYVVVSEATCEEDGKAVSVCTVCSTQFEIVLDKLGHNYEDVVVDLTSENKPGHSLVTPTCTRCGYAQAANMRHDEWLEGYYTNEKLTSPTCNLEGTTRDTCTICKTTRINKIPPAGHKFNYTGVHDCGGLHYRCAYCYETEMVSPGFVLAVWTPQLADSRIINRTGTDNTSYLDVNCDGIINGKDFAMLRLAAKKTFSHNYELQETVEPTCTSYGYKRYVCSVCKNELINDQVPALGHDFGENDDEATCKNCGKTKEEIAEEVKNNN